MKLDLKFNLFDSVTIIDIDRPGIVLGISIDSSATWYNVRYFEGCEAKFVLFLEKELHFFKLRS